MRHATRAAQMLVCAGLLLLHLTQGCENSEQKASGQLEGTVTIGPLCPVEPCEPTPQDRSAAYAARSVIVFAADGATLVAELEIDASGGFSAVLEAGAYVIDIDGVPGDSTGDVPVSIEIAPGETTTVDIDIDTGIR